jgi:hypothetical protein
MKLLSEVFKSVKKSNNKKPNKKQKTKNCQMVSELDMVGGLLPSNRPSPPYKPDLQLITNL